MSMLVACRTVQVPEGVSEEELFHVIINSPDGSNNNTQVVVGVTCPKGVKAGDTIVIVDPGSSPPITPDQIARINERRLLEGLDEGSAKFVATSFWNIVWPTLLEEGWQCKKESQYNFGAVTFYSPAAKLISSVNYRLNQEYFESIVTVLNSIKASKSELVDICYADAQKRKADHNDDVAADRWKYSAGIGELKHSRVGSKYQATELPLVGTSSLANNDCILESIIDVKQRDSIPTNWREWANNDAFAIEYHNKILEAKKEFRQLTTLINKPIGFCMWYYYSKYKTSAHYTELKTLLRADDDVSPEEHLDECVICNDGGDLICCDSCPNAYHLTCLGITNIDEDADWFCPECTEEKTRNLSPRRSMQSPSKNNNRVAVDAANADTVTRNLFTKTTNDQTARIIGGIIQEQMAQGATRNMAPAQSINQLQLVPSAQMRTFPVSVGANGEPIQPKKVTQNEKYGYGDRYSAANVKARINPDGTVFPVQRPKRMANGMFARPAGRQRLGMDWDGERGCWYPVPEGQGEK